MESDTDNFIYYGNMEQEAISFYDPAEATDAMLLRNPRLERADTLSMATDGNVYFTVNQSCLGSGFYPGTNRQKRPFGLFRAMLPNGATKVLLKKTSRLRCTIAMSRVESRSQAKQSQLRIRYAQANFRKILSMLTLSSCDVDVVGHAVRIRYQGAPLERQAGLTLLILPYTPLHRWMSVWWTYSPSP